MGRPPRLSREQIVAVTADLMREAPATPVTMARVAEAAGATPMAIYRHVRDRDDLLSAVLEHVLGELTHEIPEGADWRMQVRAWMSSVLDHLTQFPQCRGLLRDEAGLSPAWLRSMATLVEILERTGLTGEALVRAMFWVSTSTVGYAQLATDAGPADWATGLRAGLDGLPDDDARALRPLIGDVDTVIGTGVDVMMAGVIAGVEALLPVS